MSKRLLWALLLIALTAILLILNTKGAVSLNLVFGDLKMTTAVALLLFTSIGVTIGILLK
ncbi:MAG: hypothetical protein QGI24_08565 [Kiritimatiellia bacterium]|jgi:uncharacterized integral membrane protein|nr:hypothetical protein [Kiritimatiellia bacterium]MDP6848825.1 hypothetical protein [Kiritimatiellia bacterium]